ncbi:MAG TPA: cation transporting ATPase C-terminal domain-containing protein, partial [Symbiobacteriaceae bacterium]|nr:cation transporting ATPase C-terminal domain-containing protein [Symbiobacteriaceae bacterium]
LLAIYWPPMAEVFNTAALTWREWCVVLGFAAIGEIAVVLRRLVLYGRPVRVTRQAGEEA